LIDEHGLKCEQIEALVVVTQNPDAHGLPHTAAIVQKKLGLSTHVAAFDVSLGCSGFVYGLSITKGLMEQAGLANGVLVTADPYSKIVDRNDRVTSLLFGDAATATWLSAKAEWKIGVPIFQTNGAGEKDLCVEDGILKMNGRRVFNFAALVVPAQINQWLARNTLEPTDIDLYCLHQGSANIIDAISRRFPEVRNRFIKDIENTGNTVSSSIPILLEKYVMKQDFQKILISGFGVGLSWATNMIYKEK
jgi:3-oxoacyl-[acyl-carrier-protein] synthase-3